MPVSYSLHLPRPFVRACVGLAVISLAFWIGGLLLADRRELHQLRQLHRQQLAANGNNNNPSQWVDPTAAPPEDSSAHGRNPLFDGLKRPLKVAEPDDTSAGKLAAAADDNLNAGTSPPDNKHAPAQPPNVDDQPMQPNPDPPAAADPGNAQKPPSPPPAPNAAKPGQASSQQPVDHTHFQSRLSSAPYRLTDPRWDHMVIALKSGIEVAADKVPIQLATFLQGVKNIWLFGDGVMRVGDYEMVDVVTGTYDAAVQRLEKQGRLAAARAWSPMKVKYEEAQKRKKNREKLLRRRDVTLVQEPSPLSVRLEKRAKADVEVKPDQESMGWKNDAHKNIPAIRELVNRYPDAAWYIMIDDDTYVFMENLHRVLHSLNPDEPHYLGAPNTFRDCDGVTEMGDGPLFNHGGSGIVVSRGAAREMVKIVDECIVRYHDCFAGDVRLGLCLRDAGILANYKYPGRRWFNPVTPHWSAHPYYEDPCKRVVTFHHLSKATMQKLYDIERDVFNRTLAVAERHARAKQDLVNPTTTPHLFFSNGTQPGVFSHLTLPPHLPSPYSSPIHLEDMWHHFVDTDAHLPDIEPNIARAGEQYLVYTGTKDAKHCRWLCSREDRCVAWHFLPNGRCEVKDSVTRPVRMRGHASGLIKGRFRCKTRTY